MDSAVMHSEAEGAPAKPKATCQTCGGPFTPRRRWARFCSTPCRNAFHGSEKRKDAIRVRALDLYAALANIARETGTPYGTTAAAAIEGLKPPAEPKDLLEKAKA